MTAQAPHLGLQVPHLALQAPHLALQAPHLPLQAPHFCIIPALHLFAPHIMAQPPRAAAVTTAEARVRARVEEREFMVMLLIGRWGMACYCFVAAPHLALHLGLAAPHLAPHLALAFAFVLCFAPLALHAAGLAPQAPHLDLAAVVFGPHLAPAQVAAMTLPLNAAAVTTAEARALVRWDERLLMEISCGNG